MDGQRKRSAPNYCDRELTMDHYVMPRPACLVDKNVLPNDNIDNIFA